MEGVCRQRTESCDCDHARPHEVGEHCKVPRGRHRHTECEKEEPRGDA